MIVVPMPSLKQYIPLLNDLKDYSKGLFQQDLIAGITVGVMLVPQGMAYAYLAGMPPIYGLYAGLVPLIAYAFFGSSRHLSVGPVAVSALLVYAGLSDLAKPHTETFVELAIFTGLLIGLVQMALSAFRLGLLVNFISHPVISGFTSAAAVVVAMSQLDDIIGIDIPRHHNQLASINYILNHLSDYNWLSVLFGFGSLTILILLRRWNKRMPGALLVVVAGTLLSWLLNLQDQGLEVVGDVPKGLPKLGLPDMSKDTFVALLPTVFIVTAISIVESLGIAKFYEGKSKGYQVQNNQELFALGIANFLGAFSRSIPTSGSFSRSAVNFSAHAKTHVSSLVLAVIVGLSLLFLTPLFRHLPMSVLAAIILLAVYNLFDYAEAARLWRVHKRDFVMLVSTFLGTLILGIELGVLLGFALSIITVLYRSSKPNVAVLGRIKGTNYYRSTNRYQSLEVIADTKIVRFDDQLYYGNAYYFRDKIISILSDSKATKFLILDASNIHDMDSTGLTVLKDIKIRALEMNIELRFCNLVEQVEDILENAGFLAGSKAYNSIEEALKR